MCERDCVVYEYTGENFIILILFPVNKIFHASLAVSNTQQTPCIQPYVAGVMGPHGHTQFLLGY